MRALQTMKDPAIEARRRGVPVRNLMPFWKRGEADE
jgi:hypothetical protein